MSAPVSHDPLVVNTKDGAVWRRRAVTADGRGLYAADGTCACPEFLLVPLSELAVHGIVDSADVLPAPVGPLPLTARQKVDEAFGIEARLFQHALDKVFSVLTEGGFLAAPSQIAALRTRVAELEAELATANDVLDDTAKARRADARQALPWAHEMPDADLHGFLDGLVSAAMGRWRSGPEVPDRTVLADIERVCAQWRTPGEGYRSDPEPEDAPAPVAALREVSSREEPHDSLLHRDWQLGHDLPTGGA